MPEFTPERVTRVLLVRHGESTFNQQGRYQGRCDEPVLTERGLHTALQTGCYLKNERLDVILSSPLRRARQTAEAILSALDNGASRRVPELVFHELLKEVDLVRWEGLTFAQVRKDFAREYRTWADRPHLLRMVALRGNGEAGAQIRPVADLYRRAGEFWREVLPAYAGKSVLVVSHGGTTRALVGAALGIPARFYHRTQHSHGGITILQFDGRFGRWGRIEALNLTRHLGERFPKLKEGKRGVRLVLLPARRARVEPANARRLLERLKPDFVVGANASALGTGLEGLPEFHAVGEETIRRWQQQSARALVPAALSAVARSPLTGLVIAPVRFLLPALLSAAGARKSDSARWNVEEDSISVLHYPDLNGPPVLQALNIPAIAANLDAQEARS